MTEKYLIYDLETFLNCFTAYFRDFKTGREKVFVIHESQNDLKAMMEFLRAVYRNGYWLVGYNCNGFDAQILEFIFRNYKRLKRMDGNTLARTLYSEAQRIIHIPREEKYLHLIMPWNFTIPHLDIFKFKHYDGKQKSCSLKWLEFTMRFPNIESMPLPHWQEVLDIDIPAVIKYNGNDVHATAKSFELNQYEVDLRAELSMEYDLDLMNASEPRLARDIFGKFLSEAMHLPYRELKQMRTERDRIYTKDVIFPYVKFKHPILKGVREFYENLNFNPSFTPDNNYNLKTVEKTFAYHNLPEVVVGLGGIHACVKPGVYTDRPGWKIRDIDGTSYYPNIGIQNELFPEHLSKTFCKVYKDIFDARQKIDKKSPINYIYKIILNSTYGLSKEVNNYMYDPKYTFAITVNGQLMLLMLAEMMTIKVKSVMFYQLNTDGVTIGYDESEEEAVNWVMDRWAKLTKINLEDKFYEKMVIMDVNNYIAVDKKGGVKRKGLFGYSMKPEDREMDYHKNPSMLIVPKALEAFFIHNVPVKDYIMHSQDIYDFCIGVKKKDNFDIIEYYLDPATQQVKKNIIDQKVIRYYVSTEQRKLKKKYDRESKKPGAVIDLESGWGTKMFNVYEQKQMSEYNIDYSYYITEARKVIDAVSPHATNLKLF